MDNQFQPPQIPDKIRNIDIDAFPHPLRFMKNEDQYVPILTRPARRWEDLLDWDEGYARRRLDEYIRQACRGKVDDPVHLLEEAFPGLDLSGGSSTVEETECWDRTHGLLVDMMDRFAVVSHDMDVVMKRMGAVVQLVLRGWDFSGMSEFAVMLCVESALRRLEMHARQARLARRMGYIK